jgi:hypothetical protein
MPIQPGAWSARVLVDSEHLYAVGEGGVVAGDADTMGRTGSVEFFPVDPEPLTR